MIKNHIGKHVDDESLMALERRYAQRHENHLHTIVNCFTFLVIAVATALLILAFVRPVLVQ